MFFLKSFHSVLFMFEGGLAKKKNLFEFIYTLIRLAGLRSAVGRAPDSKVRVPGCDTRSGHIYSFLLPLIQEGQLSVTGESMCTKYWLTA